MSAGPLQIELPPERHTDAFSGAIPWILAVACTLALAYLVFDLTKKIPEALHIEATTILNGSQFRDVSVSTTGRDLHLSGTIDQGESLDPLLDDLHEITGVRTIKDRVRVVNPAMQESQASEQFQQLLGDIATQTVDFQAGSALFTEESESALSALLKVMSTHSEQRIRIEGHTDNTGSDSVNLRLSQDRAAAVAQYLSQRGIDPDRLIVKGYGSTQPIADNDSEAGRSANRRIEITHVY
ncbi:MAG: OmpA family protein [Granulosicoccus sp.]|nr:OmpA family protein [Granulosicoccus sp.]